MVLYSVLFLLCIIALPGQRDNDVLKPLLNLSI